MSAATSPATGRPYGLTLVCEAWRVPRSSFSAARARRRAPSPAPAPPPEAPVAAAGRPAATAPRGP
jgi:hypothetical protein